MVGAGVDNAQRGPAITLMVPAEVSRSPDCMGSISTVSVIPAQLCSIEF